MLAVAGVVLPRAVVRWCVAAVEMDGRVAVHCERLAADDWLERDEEVDEEECEVLDVYWDEDEDDMEGGFEEDDDDVTVEGPEMDELVEEEDEEEVEEG